MSANPFIRITPADAFKLKVIPGGSGGQATIENSHKRLADFDREYVSFGGYFGIHNPEMFAAAPDMLYALKLALEYWADRQQRYKNRAPVWVQEARAAIARATPTAEGVA